MLTSKVREKVELPHEPGQWIEIRQLSAQHLQEAREARAEVNLRAGRRFLEMMQMRKQAGLDEPTPVTEPAPDAEPAPEVVADPLFDFDAFTLLKYGVVGWSYAGEPVTVGSIADLDEETVEVVARRLVPRARTEEERKNVSTSSTKPSKGEPEPPITG